MATDPDIWIDPNWTALVERIAALEAAPPTSGDNGLNDAVVSFNKRLFVAMDPMTDAERITFLNGLAQ